MAKVLIIEENPQFLDNLQQILLPAHDLHVWPNGKDLQMLLRQEEYEIVLLNLQMENTDTFGMLKQLRSCSPYTPLLVISQVEETSLIVRAVKEGAFDFFGMPFSKEKLLLSIDRALEHRNLRNEIDYLRRQQDVVYDFDQIIAGSPMMKQMIQTLKKFARTDSTILMTGETGTGKSFLSGSVHFNSKRRTRPFITINCANISETLLESELFAHEKGAFTGANKTRVGRLEQGRGGTVFLDEIGEMSPALQAKLLRVLEDKVFERVGGNRTIHSDVRHTIAVEKDHFRVFAANINQRLHLRV